MAVYSCFNPNGNDIADVRFPPGFSMGQLELFGVQGAKEPPAPPKPSGLVKPPVSDLPFIITYWCGPPKSETTLERYKEIADAGFNVAFPAIDVLWASLNKENEEHNRKYLDLCQKVGLKALVWDGSIPSGKGWDKPVPDEVPQIEKALDGIIGRYSAHPAMLGYVVSDEPGVESFPRLGLVNQYLLKKDPKHLPYINLLPAYAGPPGNAWRLPKYKDTLAKYMHEVKPALVSWDHYRQMFEGGDESTYWHNLEIVRKLCVKTGVPYNQIIVSLKHMGYRECSEVNLRWQAYTSVAFGSHGITYFTYWDVKELAWAGAPAIMTLDGKRDKKYDYVKKINHRIAATVTAAPFEYYLECKRSVRSPYGNRHRGRCSRCPSRSAGRTTASGTRSRSKRVATRWCCCSRKSTRPSRARASAFSTSKSMRRKWTCSLRRAVHRSRGSSAKSWT